MKRPNGYGTIKKLGGKRRNPFAVVITTGWELTEDGRAVQKNKYLGYYRTEREASAALAEYNRDPLSFGSSVTFEEVYQMWSEKHFKKVSESNIKGIKASYKLCEPLHKKNFSRLRLIDLQNVVDNCGKNYPTLRKLKVLISLMYDFAMKNDLCVKDYSEYIDIIQYKDRNPNKYDRHPFTDSEIALLWKNKKSEVVKVALCLIYTGVRINELLDLEVKNVNIDEKYFDVVASKTEAGIRTVPIADKILPFFEERLETSERYLFEMEKGRKWLYRNFYDSYWKPAVQGKLGIDKTPHCARHTTTTLLKKAGVDDQIIRKIIGHSGKNVTEITYTHFDLPWLLEAINKI